MKIAVIGGGISGLGSAWILSQKHEVHLFESENRLGGHAHTVQVQSVQAGKVPVDTGFLVYNDLTYPHLRSFFKELQVETVESDMSLAVRSLYQGLEWAGTNLDTVFAQRRNLLRPRFLQMLADILRFHRESEENLRQAQQLGWSLGELLKRGKYSEAFRKDYLLPIGAAIWSTPEKGMESFPASTFLAFFINHRLLQINERPVWRTVKGGSIEYVQKVAAKIPFIHTGVAVSEVQRQSQGVQVRVGGESLNFDAVVFATHAPVTSRILRGQSPLERKVLSAVQTQNNRTILHQDESFMPERKKCWSSWNVLSAPPQEEHEAVSLTYFINKLQPLGTPENYFVTLNPRKEIHQPLGEFDYAHPQFDQKAIEAQTLLPEIQGQGGVYFAGAWTRYGFHEDGLLSAVRVAELFGIQPQWWERL
ncbi:MAG: FAD-dependent oxidoreductase [Bdellovibrionales bacterium]|nr:FAD-dependent oxidoreductase [Bdellovibrionales bacterium]